MSEELLRTLTSRITLQVEKETNVRLGLVDDAHASPLDHLVYAYLQPLSKQKALDHGLLAVDAIAVEKVKVLKLNDADDKQSPTPKALANLAANIETCFLSTQLVGPGRIVSWPEN